MFKLGKINFEIEEETSFFSYREEEGFALDIHTKWRKYAGERCTPSLYLNTFETDKKELHELVGTEICIATIEEADEREDTFYLFEHEPMVRYQLKIIDVKDRRVHIQLEGVVVEDGYADPYTTETLEVDCWLKLHEKHA